LHLVPGISNASSTFARRVASIVAMSIFLIVITEELLAAKT
jgi:hypothetical protein